MGRNWGAEHAKRLKWSQPNAQTGSQDVGREITADDSRWDNLPVPPAGYDPLSPADCMYQVANCDDLKRDRQRGALGAEVLRARLIGGMADVQPDVA